MNSWESKTKWCSNRSIGVLFQEHLSIFLNSVNAQTLVGGTDSWRQQKISDPATNPLVSDPFSWKTCKWPTPPCQKFHQVFSVAWTEADMQSFLWNCFGATLAPHAEKQSVLLTLLHISVVSWLYKLFLCNPTQLFPEEFPEKVISASWIARMDHTLQHRHVLCLWEVLHSTFRRFYSPTPGVDLTVN